MVLSTPFSQRVQCAETSNGYKQIETKQSNGSNKQAQVVSGPHLTQPLEPNLLLTPGADFGGIKLNTLVFNVLNRGSPAVPQATA